LDFMNNYKIMSATRTLNKQLVRIIGRNYSRKALINSSIVKLDQCLKSAYNGTSILAQRRMLSTATVSDDYEYGYSNPSNSFKSMCQIFDESVVKFKDRNVLGSRVGDEFQWITYETLGEEVQKFRNVLTHMNVSVNDKVAIISNNRTEWVVAWYAAVSIGAQIVPMYEAQAERDWRYIINDSESKLVLCATEQIYGKVKGYIDNVGNVKNVLCFDSDDELMHSYKRWMNSVTDEEPVLPAPLKKDDVATIIYTSGTTGNPKGVELSQNNLVSNLMALKAIWGDELRDDNISLAFLPWAHVFGQTAELHSAILNGASMGIVPNREAILESFLLVKPTILVSVPALFNRIYDGVMSKISQASPLKQKLFNVARSAKRDYNSDLEFGIEPGFMKTMKAKLADKIVFSKIRETFGGRLRWSAAGGAATSLEVAQFFEDMGVPICEGYGLTETSPVISSCSSSWKYRRLGCSGVPLQDVDVRILDPVTLEEVPLGEEGEVTCAGPNVMLRYRNNQAANDEVFIHKFGKKFFRTGDLGKIHDGRFLKLTGRIKEQYKLENGKYVVPAPLEDMLCRSRFVLQSFIYGDNEKYNVCLIVPDPIELEAWAKSHKIEGSTEELLTKPEVIELLSEEIGKAAQVMKNYEQPRRWTFLPGPFTQENQMLTPKMSVRRKGVLEAYGNQIEELYASTSGYDVTKP